MNQDLLFLLRPDFADPLYPGRIFYCQDCATVEGALLSAPELAKKIQIKRISWPRPRKEVVDLVGEGNQSLPLLILKKGDSSSYQTGSYNGLHFISDVDKILAALAERYQFPEPHP